MASDDALLDLAGRVASNLPFLRRYARAVAGNQESGDARVAATLEVLIEKPDLFDRSFGDKVALFRIFHALSTDHDLSNTQNASRLQAKASEHLSKLTINSREALLL